MNEGKQINELYLRLVALWVVCEAFAGGILHAAKVPFTGMVVSGLAVICIILIARFTDARFNVIKATMIVASFKLMLSPHSPPTAYIAVFFQGYMGQLLLHNNRFFKISVIMFAILALVESSLQRLLVLVILYGETFWIAVDKYIARLLNTPDSPYSTRLAAGYVFIHALVGLVIGNTALRIVRHAVTWQQLHPDLLIEKHETDHQPVRRNKKKIRPLFIITSLLLLMLLVHALLFPETSVLPISKVSIIFYRSVIIILAWYFFIAPLIIKSLKKYFSKRNINRQPDAQRVFDLLPEIRNIFTKAWTMSAERKGKRISVFIKILTINILRTDKAL